MEICVRVRVWFIIRLVSSVDLGRVSYFSYWKDTLLREIIRREYVVLISFDCCFFVVIPWSATARQRHKAPQERFGGGGAGSSLPKNHRFLRKLLFPVHGKEMTTYSLTFYGER